MKKRYIILPVLILAGFNAFAIEGTWIAIEKFEPSMGAYEFVAHVREQIGLDTALVNLPKITSDATDQPLVEARSVYVKGINDPVNPIGTVHTPWTPIGQLDMSGELTNAMLEVRETLWDPVRLEVRLVGTSVTACMSEQTFHAGTSIVLDGQSDVDSTFYFGLSASSTTNPPPLEREGNVQYIYFHRDNVAGHTIIKHPLQRWALTSGTDRIWRPAPAVMVANMLHRLKPGRTFLITIAAMNGMGIGDQLQYDTDNRLWEHEQDIANCARLGGFHPGLIQYFVSSGTGTSFCEAFGAMMFGKQPDGTIMGNDDVFEYKILNWLPDLNPTHFYTDLWDINRFRLAVLCPWNSSDESPLISNKAGLIKTVTDNPVYAANFTSPPWSLNMRSYYKGWAYGDSSHPDRMQYDGAARSAMLLTHSILSLGNVVSPVLGHMTGSQWNPLGQRQYVMLKTDFGPVTTWRRIRGEARTGGAEVLGFMIDGVPAKYVTIRDINGNPADQGYLWIEKNDKSSWTGLEVITRATNFTGNVSYPENYYDFNDPNNDPLEELAHDGVVMDWPGVVSGPSEYIPLATFGDAPGWASYDGASITSTIPVAAFSAMPTSGIAPLSVTFSDNSAGSITNRYWDFGDGTTTNTTETSVAHVYDTPGTNTVYLIVSGLGGRSTNVQSGCICVVAATPPLAGFTATPVSGTAPLSVVFVDTSTGTITNRYWDFGDGTATNTSATNIIHIYTNTGMVTVRLIVSGLAGVSTNTQTGIINISSNTTTGLIIYDAFNDAVSASTVPAGWVSDDATKNHASIRTGSLNYSGLTLSFGNSFGLGQNSADYLRSFPPTSLVVGDTIYFSLLMRINSPLDPFGDSAFTFRLYDSADIYGTGVSVSRGTTNYINNRMAFSLNNRNVGFTTASKTEEIYEISNTVYLIVGSYTRGSLATNGAVKLWINPTVGATAPVATLTTASYASDSRFDTFRIGANGSGSNPSSWQIDELRIGTSWAAVVPSGCGADSFADADNDSIPDNWESQYFGGGTNADPNVLAANGLNTVIEAYIAGLDPTNAQSIFSVSNDRDALRWTAVSGRVYSVYWATNLLNGFQPLETNIVWPQNSWTGRMDQVGVFYKISVRLQN